VSVRKKVLKAKEIGRRLRGLSAFGFGASWDYPAVEREIVRKLIVFLEDRRALFNPLPLEVEDHVIASVGTIRDECTKTLAALGDSASAAGPIRVIRAVCRRFLDGSYPSFPDIAAHLHGNRHREAFDVNQYRLRARTRPDEFFTALGELRAFVGQQIAILATCVY
jgi:hypothetical protein